MNMSLKTLKIVGDQKELHPKMGLVAANTQVPHLISDPPLLHLSLCLQHLLQALIQQFLHMKI